MLQSRRRRIRGWTEEETAAFHARVDALMAEVTADEDAGRFVATEWLVGRAAEGRGSDGWCGIRTDGYSIFHNYGDCAVTWVGGPRHRYDPDVALLSRQRLPTGSFAIRVWGGVQGVLESRAIPYVLVRPPYSLGYYRTDPEGLVHGWEHSQAVVHMLQTGGFRQAAKDLVWAWIHGEEAEFMRPWCRDYVHADAIVLNEAIALTWAPDARIALLSKRRYALNTFRRILRDAIRDALAAHDVQVREVAPNCRHAWVESDMLIGAWEREASRVG